MVDLLTEQIAGLYDPKAHEFYVADWIPIEDQKMVMAHELTHALEDQHFQIETWVKAARPNDDAELAREAVLEGSAMAAMVDYLMAGTGRSSARIYRTSIRRCCSATWRARRIWRKAPPFLKDALIFPYLDGLTFSAAVLKASGLERLYPECLQSRRCPRSRSCIRSCIAPAKAAPQVTLPSMDKTSGPIGKSWKTTSWASSDGRKC